MEMRARLSAAFTSLGHVLCVVQDTPEYAIPINLVAADLGLSLVPAGLSGRNRDAVCYKPLRSTPLLLTNIVLISPGRRLLHNHGQLPRPRRASRSYEIPPFAGANSPAGPRLAI